jgi:hypothetical protein
MRLKCKTRGMNDKNTHTHTHNRDILIINLE